MRPQNPWVRIVVAAVVGSVVALSMRLIGAPLGPSILTGAFIGGVVMALIRALLLHRGEVR